MCVWYLIDWCIADMFIIYVSMYVYVMYVRIFFMHTVCVVSSVDKISGLVYCAYVHDVCMWNCLSDVMWVFVR